MFLLLPDIKKTFRLSAGDRQIGQRAIIVIQRLQMIELVFLQHQLGIDDFEGGAQSGLKAPGIQSQIFFCQRQG